MARVVLVHNPEAGDGYPDRETLIELVRDGGYEVEYASSAEAGWTRAVDGDSDLIAVAGGDGTVGKVARHVAGREIALAIIPLGTANNVSAAIGLARAPLDQLVAGWRRSFRQPFDIGVARGPWGTFRFLESVGAGLLALGMAEVERGHVEHLVQIEDTAARLAAARELFQRQLTHTQTMRFAVSLDGVDRSGEYLMVEAMNFGVAGPNLRLAAHGDPADGLLDVVLAGDENRRALRGCLAGRLSGSASERLPVHQVRTIRLSCPACAVHLDDQLWLEQATGADAHPIELSIEHHALTFLRPR